MDDIVPCVWVGLNTSGEATIKDGFLKINNISVYKLSDVRSLQGNVSSVRNNDTVSSDAFVMEPGRTIFVFMRLCNKATLCSEKFVNSVLIIKENSQLLTSENGEPLTVSISNLNSRRKRALPSVVVETPSGKKIVAVIYMLCYKMLIPSDLQSIS